MAVAAFLTDRVTETKFPAVPAVSFNFNRVFSTAVLDESKANSSSSSVETVKDPVRVLVESLFLTFYTLKERMVSVPQLLVVQSRLMSIDAIYVPKAPSPGRRLHSVGYSSLKHLIASVSVRGR